MKVIRKLFPNRGMSRFDSYYSQLLRQGSGYPTADEARRDLNELNRFKSHYSWPR